MSGTIEQPRFTCALGSCQSVVAIKKGVPILHSGPGCGGQISRLIGQGEGYAGGSTAPCTNAEEADVVFGGEKKLRSVIENSFKVIDGDIYVVLTGCTAAITGDDIAAVTGEFQEEDKPIVYVEEGGFRSNNYASHERLVNAIIDQYVDKFKYSDEKEEGLVNVFASIPYQDPYWSGNLEGIKKVLTDIGLKVNILFGNESDGVEEWKRIPNAQFNIVIGPWVGVKIAKHLKVKYGQPFLQFPYLPIGAIETSRFLRSVAEFGHLDEIRVENYIKKEEAKYYAHIEKMADFMLEFRYGIPRRVYTIADSSYALGFSKFLLNELGIIPGPQYIVDDIPEKYQDRVKEEFDNISILQKRTVEVVFDPDAGKNQLRLEEDAKNYEDKRILILGSSWDKNLADKLHADLLIISVPVQHRLIMNCGYTGYEGGLRAIEDIYDRVLATYR
ncbi:hydrogenase [Agathobacter ruminis]|uniref:Hydrogenase n=2 Tax=Agathobacter ruminis TaxID=1712665 RepID=A0A2G3E5M6_9FIRM|nr:nitrogenase component 1 [Agathobacter ruminis]MDC7300523.1 hydrogenase [Agathobacter ruminis]PHU38511.1 hydrogenase [Agathobacter ruminis]